MAGAGAERVALQRGRWTCSEDSRAGGGHEEEGEGRVDPAGQAQDPAFGDGLGAERPRAAVATDTRTEGSRVKPKGPRTSKATARNSHRNRASEARRALEAQSGRECVDAGPPGTASPGQGSGAGQSRDGQRTSKSGAASSGLASGAGPGALGQAQYTRR